MTTVEDIRRLVDAAKREALDDVEMLLRAYLQRMSAETFVPTDKELVAAGFTLSVGTGFVGTNIQRIIDVLGRSMKSAAITEIGICIQVVQTVREKLPQRPKPVPPPLPKSAPYGAATNKYQCACGAVGPPFKHHTNCQGRHK